MAGLSVCVYVCLLGGLVVGVPKGRRDEFNDIESLVSSSQCKLGWEKFQSSCYKFVSSEDRTWHSAKQACLQENSHLVSVQSSPEFQYIKGMIEKGVEEEGGILFHELWWTSGREQEDGTWVWDDGTGSPVSFENVNWYPGEPSNTDGNEDYLDILYMDGKWGLNDAPNAFQLRSICEYDMNPISCREGWKFFDGHCYQFVVSKDRTWLAAQEACEHQESHLVSVDTSSEFDFIKQEIGRQVEGQGAVLWHELWWTGGRKLSNSNWVWDEGDSTHPVDFESAINWYPGEPNNHDDNENYLDILYKNSVWGMNDAPNSFQLRSICEYEPNPCQAGWKYYQNTCYKFVLDHSSSHGTASEECTAEKAHLVSVKSEGEFNFLKEEIKAAVMGSDEDFTRELWWTSGFRIASSDVFVWDDGTDQIIDNQFWYPGEPNNDDGSEDFVSILYSSDQWGLNDAPSKFHLHYICERKL